MYPYSSTSVHQPRVRLIANGQNQTNGDRYYKDQNTGISLVVRSDGGHHFSKDRRTIQLHPSDEAVLLEAYRALVQPDPVPQVYTAPVPAPSYTGPGFWGQASAQQVRVPAPGDYGMHPPAPSQQAQQQALPSLRPNGGNQNTGEIYYKDDVSGYSLVVDGRGRYHFSMNRQTVNPLIDTAVALVRAYNQQFADSNGSYLSEPQPQPNPRR